MAKLVDFPRSLFCCGSVRSQHALRWDALLLSTHSTVLRYVGGDIATGMGKYTIVRHTADSTNRARFPLCVPHVSHLKW